MPVSLLLPVLSVELLSLSELSEEDEDDEEEEEDDDDESSSESSLDVADAVALRLPPSSADAEYPAASLLGRLATTPGLAGPFFRDKDPSGTADAAPRLPVVLRRRIFFSQALAHIMSTLLSWSALYWLTARAMCSRKRSS